MGFKSTLSKKNYLFGGIVWDGQTPFIVQEDIDIY